MRHARARYASSRRDSIRAVHFLRQMIAGIRPGTPLRVSQEVHTCGSDRTVKIALVHVEGEVSRRGGAYDHGQSVSGGTTREDAMILIDDEIDWSGSDQIG